MSIGTSLGAFHEDEFQHSAGINTDPSIDNNVVDPDIDPEGMQPKPKPTIIPQPVSDIKTSSPLVTITDKDIDTGIGLGLAFSGGGLKTEAETVGKAALMYKGERYEGQNHGFALGDILDKFPDADMKQIDQGFTTSKGRFVSREEAFDIAKKQDQIDNKVLPSLTEESRMLLSEDLKGNTDYLLPPRKGGKPYTSPDSPIDWPFSSPPYNHDAHVDYKNGN